MGIGKSIAAWTQAAIRTSFFYLFRLCPIQDRKIVFVSFYGKFANDAPRAVYDAIRDKDVSCVWIVKDGAAPAGAKSVRPDSIASVYQMATARIWVDNCRKPVWVRKRRGQFYIQTWHGSVALKKVEKDTEASLNPTYVRMAVRDSAMADLFLSETEWRTQNYLSAFWYHGEVLKGQFLRGAKELTEGEKAEIKTSFGFPEDVKLALYMPTFRNRFDPEVFRFSFQKFIDAAKEKFGGEWRFLLKLHPNVAERSGELFAFGDRVKDASAFQDVQKLIDAADILITDFSGCMFDGFRKRKIVFLFAKDYEAYVKENRSLYFDLSDFPSAIAESEEALLSRVSDFDEAAYREKAERLIERIGYYPEDGLSLCSEKILSVMDEKAKGGKRK